MTLDISHNHLPGRDSPGVVSCHDDRELQFPIKVYGTASLQLPPFISHAMKPCLRQTPCPIFAPPRTPFLRRSIPPLISTFTACKRTMATVKDSIPHVIRTADDPRQSGVWPARLSKIDQINSSIRVLRLSLPKDGVCVVVLEMPKPPSGYLPRSSHAVEIIEMTGIHAKTAQGKEQCLYPGEDTSFRKMSWAMNFILRY
jgi:hypothetical protein